MINRCTLQLSSALLLTLTLLGLTLIYPALVTAGPGARPAQQGPGSEWIIWEMAQPPQSLLLDGATLWLGSYKGGLYQWHVENGYQAHYTTTHGLAGDDITGLALDGSGNRLVAALDGGLAVSGSPFSDLTPPNGQRAWDIALAGNGDIWLATLGGGAARYSGGSWSSYNRLSSTLPADDVYAVAVEGTTPWVGTIGYGLARFDGSDWVTYTLPVEIAHPVTATDTISNNAIADIAVDSGGNKWLATDGSGVVVLDSANSGWTQYDSGNSGLPADFVHSVTLDGNNRWFGTLGGGAARLDVSSSSWQTLDSSNSLLPEDDVLDVAVDANGGLWLATFETGLAYYGALPATPPTFALAPQVAPAYRPGQAKGYYLWLDPESYIWYLAWSGDGSSHDFGGRLTANAPVLTATATHFEGGDALAINGGTLTITATEAISQDMVSFVLSRNASQLTIDLKIDGAYRPFNIQIGAAGAQPGTAPFRLTTPQPLPPEVLIETNGGLEEGQFAFVTAILTDTDTPVDHQITWQMGDGRQITGTLVPSHTYVDEGLYNVTLAITDVHGESGSDSQPVTVTNVAPEVDFFYEPERPEPNQTLTFYGSLFDPGSNDSHTYLWEFGDGITATGGLTVSHSYALTGTYDVTLTIADNDGGSGVLSYPLVIEPFGADFTGYPGVGLPPFTATFYDTSTGLVTTRTWRFGDGSPAVTTNTTVIDHSYATPGIYDVGLTITGPSGVDVVTRSGYIVAVSPETSGTIILEAEDYTRQFAGTGTSWVTGATHLGYAGSGYVQARPDVDIQVGANDIWAGAELQYDLGLTITGTYYLWLRGYAPNAAGDSLYIGLNSQPITTTDYMSAYPPEQWAWGHTLAQSSQPVTLAIDYPGVHTLNIWAREDGFGLDQIILTTNGGFNP